ncbi:MAG: helix-turn-helix domain-containing protein [Acetobacteraceae bacterium]|nr:helix-turn-helix domain-containing protein [Acetobacteraceae bacterium]
MTMPATARQLDARLPSVSEAAAANQLRRVLASGGTGEQRLRILDGENQPAEIVLTPALSGLLMQMLRHIGNGEAVTIVPVGQMLTTQQAADILNVSRPFLISLLERGDIPFSLTGRHRRIRAEDLFSYKRDRDERREAALSRLAEADADLL